MQIFTIFSKKNKPLGTSRDKRKYDLPLNHDEGSRFLVLLIALMSFLAVMALAFSFSLGTLVERWSSGLENKLTVEIPAEDSSGEILAQADLQALASKVLDSLENNEHLYNVELLDQNDIETLLEPWLGQGFLQNSVTTDIPIPSLISAEILKDSYLDLNVLRYELKKIVPNIVLDQHEDWLDDLLHFTGSLQMFSAVIVFIIIFTTLIAVAGAIRSRIAEYRDDVELLHLMGARDEYITNQFQRHARIIGLQGGFIGVILALATMILLSVLFEPGESTAMPELKLSFFHYIILSFVSVVMSAVTSLGSRYTVIQALAKMP